VNFVAFNIILVAANYVVVEVRVAHVRIRGSGCKFELVATASRLMHNPMHNMCKIE
jgi:hypothetical protein